MDIPASNTVRFTHSHHRICLTQIYFYTYTVKGFAKKTIPKIRVYYGSGWVGPGLTRIFFFKSSQNSSKPVLIFWSSISCVFCLYIYIVKSCSLL